MTKELFSKLKELRQSRILDEQLRVELGLRRVGVWYDKEWPYTPKELFKGAGKSEHIKIKNGRYKRIDKKEI